MRVGVVIDIVLGIGVNREDNSDCVSHDEYNTIEREIMGKVESGARSREKRCSCI